MLPFSVAASSGDYKCPLMGYDDAMRRDLILKTLVVLAVTWALVLVGAHLLGKRTVTPEKIIGYLETDPLSGIAADDEEGRRAVIAGVAGKINRLDFKQRREMERWGEAGPLRSFGESLAPAEQSYLVRLTVEEHFRSIMEAFNGMTKEERRGMINRLRKEMQSDASREAERSRLQESDPELFENIVEKGMTSYYRDASVEVKMDLAPLLEDLQNRIQGLHRR